MYCMLTTHVLYAYNSCTVCLQLMYCMLTTHVLYAYNSVYCMLTTHVLYAYNSCMLRSSSGEELEGWKEWMFPNSHIIKAPFILCSMMDIAMYATTPRRGQVTVNHLFNLFVFMLYSSHRSWR